MRKTLRGLLSLAVLFGTVAAGGSAGAAEAGTEAATCDEVEAQVLAIPGMSLIQEKPYTGYCFWVLNYTQPVDHRDPDGGTFQQRITLLHKDASRPTVFYTGGYSVSTSPSRREPTQIVDGNQVSMEYRFFSPSRPDPADWSKLDIWQAASDQHRIYRALKPLYDKNWLATGGSKGGMTATYFERFYPADMDGVVPYVAPNDVVNKEDSAYDEFFETVGTPECRAKLDNIQREALIRREPMERMYADWAAENGATFTTVGTLDKAFEAVVLDFTWAFWQYSLEADCAGLPVAATATDQELYDVIDAISGWSFYTDQGLEAYTPYYYQAATQLGSPSLTMPHLKGLTRYGYQPARNFVPSSIPVTFEPSVMRDVDTWVRTRANHMLYVYGSNDPWGAERFRFGPTARDSYVYTAPGMNHGANIAGLAPEDRAKATASVLEWAGLSDAVVAEAKPLAKHDPKLDRCADCAPGREPLR
ncbi:Prolyl tri/tetrapeptidyl aminopeptidase [Streptomyces sp. RB5]|uniref:Prolyl tri/tetrapeptidyl aminopeptidase n=1 Tax=Streptomyces smaragdinus TaxID=2585196 RepID=A0A7K0CK35_9ACTN|nr:S28 family serine protease [Streptomyces smaragdinus]MQY13860.1 Prolyl tri/tetrapeptidyl aminopeptidase [Streptomyces smaragdinus]